MEAKTIIIGLLIGIIVGVGICYVSTPKPDISGYEEQITQLNSQVSTLQNQFEDLQGYYDDLKKDYNEAQDELENAVSPQEHDAVKAQVSQLKSQVNSLQAEVNEKDNSIQNLRQTIDYYEGMVPPPPPSEGEPGSSRFFPLDIEDTLTCLVTYRYEDYTLLFTVTEVIRGSKAWQRIYNVNQFNDPPLEGMEYVLAKIRVKYVSGPSAETEYEVDEWDFEAVSEEGYVYNFESVVLPEPELNSELFPGASHVGWTVFQVYKTDGKTVMAYARGDLGAYWFKLYED